MRKEALSSVLTWRGYASGRVLMVAILTNASHRAEQEGIGEHVTT
jgi:hypothetical protein